MSATKDQRRLLARCLESEIPVFVLTGTDQCAMAALRAYTAECHKLGCEPSFIQDLDTNVIPDFEAFQREESDKVKLPD